MTVSVPLDPETVLAVVGWKADRPPEPVNGGWDNHLWKFTCDGAAYALRVVRLEEDADLAARARGFEHEVVAMDVARQADIPVPAIAARGEYSGAPFLILEWLPGGTILDAVRRKPWLARRYGREFGRLQARLHSLPGEYLRPITDTDWVDRAGHPALAAAVQRELLTSEARFCHFDFHPLNILHDGERVTGLVDFTVAAASDIRADLGLTNAVLRAAPLPPGVPGRAMNMLRGRFTNGWREGYLDFAGRFPLDAMFEALGYGVYHYEFASAIDEGRGWASARDLKRLLILRDEALARTEIA